MRISTGFQNSDEYEGMNENFENIGHVRLFGSNIPVAKDNNQFYLLHEKTGRIVCKIEEVSDFIHKGRVIWAETKEDRHREMMIDSSGEYLIDIRTAKHVESDYPTEIEGNKFTTARGDVRWNGYEFKVSSDRSSSTEDDEEESKKIEQFLEGVDLKFGKPPDRIDDIEAEIPLVEIFESLGEGEMGDEDFIPPTQSEYADFGYTILKNNASSRNSHMFTEKYREDWKGRLRRTWPSLVRDAHFSTNMNEHSDEFDLVSDSIEQDLRGADSVIIEDGKEYHINLFVDSEKSNEYFKDKKDNRQNREIMIPEAASEGPYEIVVTTDIEDGGAADIVKSNNGRDIYLYSDRHIDAIRELIKNDLRTVEDEEGNTLCKRVE